MCIHTCAYIYAAARGGPRQALTRDASSSSVSRMDACSALIDPWVVRVPQVLADLETHLQARAVRRRREIAAVVLQTAARAKLARGYVAALQASVLATRQQAERELAERLAAARAMEEEEARARRAEAARAARAAEEARRAAVHDLVLPRMGLFRGLQRKAPACQAATALLPADLALDPRLHRLLFSHWDWEAQPEGRRTKPAPGSAAASTRWSAQASVRSTLSSGGVRHLPPRAARAANVSERRRLAAAGGASSKEGRAPPPEMSEWTKRMLGFGMLALLFCAWAGVRLVEFVMLSAAPQGGVPHTAQG